MRPHIAAVYAFARVADDIADEGPAPAADRLAQLAAWQARLHRAAASIGSESPDDRRSCTDARSRDDSILLALGHSIRTLDLPVPLFDDLLSAFGQDTMTPRYDSWSDVLDYCRRSANPIGRLVLRIAGYRDERLDRSSDALCTALQLTNFWQDFGRDYRAGRLYVPREVSESCGADEHDLRDHRMTQAWTDAIARCAAFTRARFADGRAVCDAVKGRLGIELRFTWLGGSRVLNAVENRRARLLDSRPTLTVADAPHLIW